MCAHARQALRAYVLLGVVYRARAADAAGGRRWRAEATFRSVCIWGHDLVPDDGHPLVRLQDWLAVAAVVRACMRWVWSTACG
jgi:hypothetical protein